jgi:hypothetical protein
MQNRDFKSGDDVLTTTRLRLKRPIPEFGDHIPCGVRGKVIAVGSYQGVRTSLVGFPNPRYSALLHLYTVYPVQIKRAQ